MIDFILNPIFLIPFLSTAGASITIIILQSIHKIDADRKKKLYTATYMTDVGLRLLQVNLILKKYTIIPHIETTNKIIAGDRDLLKIMFLTDEFDILTDRAMDFNNIPEEHKVLVGYDDIHLLQAFEALLYQNKINNTKNSLNDFVKLELKSELSFENNSHDEQLNILKTYLDYLDKLNHEGDRLIASVLHILLPSIKRYIGQKCFLLYSKRNITKQFNLAYALVEEYKSIIPEPDFFVKSVSGGIQKIINNDK